MLITLQTKFRMRRVKTRSEPGGDGFWGTCRSIYSAVAPYVVGTLIEMGEIVVSVSEVMVGGVALICLYFVCRIPIRAPHVQKSIQIV